MRRIVGGLVLVTLLGRGAASGGDLDVFVDEGSRAPRPGVGDAISASGKWNEATRSPAVLGQQWDVAALRFEDGQVRGRIGILGSPFFESANVEGRLSGRGVTGTLLDDEGNELASFSGAVTPTGGFGTYRDRNGNTGDWHWNGPLKVRSASAEEP